VYRPNYSTHGRVNCHFAAEFVRRAQIHNPTVSEQQRELFTDATHEFTALRISANIQVGPYNDLTAIGVGLSYHMNAVALQILHIRANYSRPRITVSVIVFRRSPCRSHFRTVALSGMRSSAVFVSKSFRSHFKTEPKFHRSSRVERGHEENSIQCEHGGSVDHG